MPATAAITWSYDTGTNGIGHLTGMTDESGSTSFTYDLHGRLLSKTQIAKIGTINYTQTLGYQYDSAGRIAQTTYPSGTQISTTYGADGRPTELRVNGNLLLSNIIYQPFGEPKSWVWGNNQAYTRSFDADGRLKTHPVGSDTRTLTYDAASRIINTVDTNPVYNRTYDYDGLDRLISQSDNTSFKLWGYDANSNRTNAQAGSSNYLYTIATNSNRLQNVAGPVAKIYTYDAAGNPLGDGATTFTWNAAGKLSTTVNNAKTHTYKTNGLDQRISKNGPLSSKFFFFYDPSGQLIGEYRDNSSTATPTDDWLVRQETIWLEDIPIAVIRKSTSTSPIQVYFIHADHLNTPRVIVNQGNNPVWRWENTHAFGANLPDEDPDGNSQLFEYLPRFPGQYFDKETGLHYNYFRYYEPETGRYISPDPIGLAGGINPYAYVENDPISFTDSEGLTRNRGSGNPRDVVPNLRNRSGGWSYGRFYPNLGTAPPRNASYPVGNSRSQFQVPPQAQQLGGQVCGRNYSGHAFDQMQARGIPPSVVNNTITTGSWYPGNTSSTSQYYSVVNNVTVVVNHNTGNTVTVRWGPPSGLSRTTED